MGWNSDARGENGHLQVLASRTWRQEVRERRAAALAEGETGECWEAKQPLVETGHKETMGKGWGQDMSP